MRRQGDDAAALQHFRAGAEVIEASREPLRDEELKISLLGRWQQVYEGLVLHCLALNRPAEAFEWAERSRARAFAEALLSEQPSPDAEEETGEQEAQFSWSTEATLKSIQASLPADGALLSYYTTGVLDRDVPLLRAIPADNALREHLLTPARTLLFVLTRQRLTVHNCSLDPNMFATASPRQDSADRFLIPAVRQRLYTALLGIAHDALEARQLCLVPHGPLHTIPFVALWEADSKRSPQSKGPYLSYAPSTTILAHQGALPEPQTTQNLSGLAIGYSGGQDGRKLRYAEPEAVMVRNLMGGQMWVGVQPKREQLREIAGQQRWLHFACHGWFNHERPLESYIETGPDERLTAREVMQGWRLQADLVTLSACQTGVSCILRGDEPMGLMRAFLYAGAKAVLISQWAVEDLPTFLLMYHFYRKLRESKGAHLSAALHSAQQWLRRLTAAQVKARLNSWPTQEGLADDSTILSNLSEDAYPFAHPRHWAAFVLVGRAGAAKSLPYNNAVTAQRS